MGHTAQSLEVSKHQVTVHMRDHGFLLEISDETLNALNLLIHYKCCEKTSLIMCVICGRILLVHSVKPGDFCDCLYELFDTED